MPGFYQRLFPCKMEAISRQTDGRTVIFLHISLFFLHDSHIGKEGKKQKLRFFKLRPTPISLRETPTAPGQTGRGLLKKFQGDSLLHDAMRGPALCISKDFGKINPRLQGRKINLCDAVFQFLLKQLLPGQGI